MIRDDIWDEFCKWCKERWCMFVPNRVSVELYLRWNEDRIKSKKMWERSKTKNA